jgi:hypothetical protein
VSGQDRHSDDAVWREIIANYGDRPPLEADDDTRVEQQTRSQDQLSQDQLSLDQFSLDQPAEPDAHPELADDGRYEERFVPPPPPPLPRVPKDRLAAWLGVLVSPMLLLVATILRIPLPTILAWMLVGAFLGGFGYLVAQMPRGPRDPFDDGARI